MLPSTNFTFQSAIILELFNLIKEIAMGALYNNTADCQRQSNLDVTLLCWSLMLLSSAFDVIAYSKYNSLYRRQFLAENFTLDFTLLF